MKINLCKSSRLMNWQWGWFCHFLGFGDLSNFLLNSQLADPWNVKKLKRKNYSVFNLSNFSSYQFKVKKSSDFFKLLLISTLLHVVHLRVLKSNIRYILRYYAELIWSKYCVEILQGKIHTDFIRMDVPMFHVDPNIHYILIAHFPRDPNWDNSVNRLLLNLGGRRKNIYNVSNLLPYSDNLSPTSIIQEWTVAEGRRDQMGRERRVRWGEMFTIINIVKTKKRGWNKKI